MIKIIGVIDLPDKVGLQHLILWFILETWWYQGKLSCNTSWEDF